MDLNESQLYPRGAKSDWLECAKEITNGNQVIDDAELTALLGWLRDYNWPGAPLIADFLNARADRVVESVKDLLLADDDEWRYWLLTVLVQRWPQATKTPLLDVLQSLSVCGKSDLEEAAKAALNG